MRDYWERSYLDDLTAEGRDAAAWAERTGQSHPLDCTCRGCVYDEAAGEEPCGYVAPRQAPQDYCERPKPCPRHEPTAFLEAS